MGKSYRARCCGCRYAWSSALLAAPTIRRPPTSDIVQITSALTAPIQNGFEDGTLQGWIPRGGRRRSPTRPSRRFAGTRSLKTTGRTAGFIGPSLNLTGQLVKGATHQVGVSVRLVAGRGADDHPGDDAAHAGRRLAGVRHHRAEHQRDRRRLGDADREPTRSRPTSPACCSTSRRRAPPRRTTSTRSRWSQTAPAPLADDFEDGTHAGLVPARRPDARQLDRAGVRRHAQPQDHGPHRRLHGPELQPARPAHQGRDLQVTAVRCASSPGQPATTLRVTVQRTPTGGSAGVRQRRAEHERHRPGLGDADRALLVHHRHDRPAASTSRRTSATASYYIDTVQHRAGRAAAGPARQHARRQRDLRERHAGGLVLAHRRRGGRQHDGRRARRHAQPADHQPARRPSAARRSTSPT